MGAQYETTQIPSSVHMDEIGPRAHLHGPSRCLGVGLMRARQTSLAKKVVARVREISPLRGSTDHATEELLGILPVVSVS